MPMDIISVMRDVKNKKRPYDNQTKKFIVDYLLSMEMIPDDLMLKVFTLPDAEEVIKKIICKKQTFSCRAERKLFTLPNAGEVVELYIKYFPLYAENEKKMFDLPNAYRLIKLYILKYSLSEKSEVRLFDFGDDLIFTYISKFPLNETSQMKIFDMPNGGRLFEFYVSLYPLVPKAERMARKLGWI